MCKSIKTESRLVIAWCSAQGIRNGDEETWSLMLQNSKCRKRQELNAVLGNEASLTDFLCSCKISTQSCLILSDFHLKNQTSMNLPGRAGKKLMNSGCSHFFLSFEGARRLEEHTWRAALEEPGTGGRSQTQVLQNETWAFQTTRPNACPLL